MVLSLRVALEYIGSRLLMVQNALSQTGRENLS